MKAECKRVPNNCSGNRGYMTVRKTYKAVVEALSWLRQEQRGSGCSNGSSSYCCSCSGSGDGSSGTEVAAVPAVVPAAAAATAAAAVALTNLMDP